MPICPPCIKVKYSKRLILMITEHFKIGLKDLTLHRYQEKLFILQLQHRSDLQKSLRVECAWQRYRSCLYMNLLVKP